MIEDIQDKLKDIEHHLDNINELIPGMCDKAALRFLCAITEAECSLREAHSYLVDPRDIDTGENLWET